MRKNLKYFIQILSACCFVFIACASCTSDSPGHSDTSQSDADSDTTETSETQTPKQSLQLEGLKGPVTVRFDKWGVLHVECTAMVDCLTAQGYYHAHHRFFEMDMIRRQARGQLAAIMGEAGLEQDVFWRHRMTTRNGTPLEEVLFDDIGAEYKTYFRAYARGVNAWLEDLEASENGAVLTKEYDFPTTDDSIPRKWEPEDSVALYLNLSQSLANTSKQDLLRGRAFAKLSPDVARDLFTPRPITDSFIISASKPSNTMQLSGSNASGAPRRPARALQRRFDKAGPVIDSAIEKINTSESLLTRGGPDWAKGSNSWVLGPSKTRNEGAILANDPHLTLLNPAIWYMVELHSTGQNGETVHAAGGSIPSVPGVIFGQNEKIAWGGTIARLDLSDVYVEKLNEAGTAVLHDGEQIPLKTKEFTFEVHRGDDVTRTLEWVPHHGPLISKDLESRQGISMRWVAQEGGNDIEFIFDLMQANTVEEGMDAVSKVRNVNVNWNFMDTDGTIGWTPRGLVPRRPWASSEKPNWLPLPGQGGAEWDGFLTADELPEMVNPSSGFIATANNNFNGSYKDGDPTNDGHPVWQSPPVPGYRHQRIVEMIEQKAPVDVDEMYRMQADVLSVHGRRLVPKLLEALPADAPQLDTNGEQIRRVLTDWNYQCGSGLGTDDADKDSKDSSQSRAEGSSGCSAFHALLRELVPSIFGDELASFSEIDPRYEWPMNRWPALQVALVDLFENPDRFLNETYFDDRSTDKKETKQQILARAFNQTGEAMDKLFESSDAKDWHWGRIHELTLPSLFDTAGITRYNHGPFPSDGGTFTVDLAPPAPSLATDGEQKIREFGHKVGPSLRLVFRGSEKGITGLFQLPGGQDHRRNSEHYMDLLDDWLKNNPHKLLFEKEAVEAAAVRSIRIEPK